MKFEPVNVYVSRIAERKPGAVAIKYDENTITYRELEIKSNKIANFLNQKRTEFQNSNPNVMVMLNRSPELIISILGILKCGLIFVPVEPIFPENRLKILLEETKSKWLITTEIYLKRFIGLIEKKVTGLNVLLVDRIMSEDNFPGNIYSMDSIPVSDKLEFQEPDNKNCYIYFTSGTTGIPKGVLGRHRSLTHFIQWEIKEFEVDENIKISQLTNPSFDPFLRDILVPLAAGGTCCIPTYDVLMNPVKLIQWIDKNEIIMMHIVPSLFREILHKIESGDCFWTLKYILFAGELLKGSDIKKFVDIFKNRIQLVNLYGPTETTLAKLFYRIKEEDVDRTVIPVGKPIDGAQAMILNEQGKRCLLGNIGEIHIRTPFISSGYFNDKELTKKKFIKNPFSHNPLDIIYKTGDLGRLLPDGNIEIAGRVDYQVKIRGRRIELEEIENLLLKYDGIKTAVVLARERTGDSASGNEDGDKYLCAYIQADESRQRENKELEPLYLKKYLENLLPYYMIPAYFVMLEKIPLTPSGKVDRKSLPEPDELNISMGINYIAPGDDWEKKIAHVWEEVLKLEKVGINDSLYDLGGNSLNIIQIGRRLNDIFAKDIPIVKLVQYTTIGSLAEYLRNENNGIDSERIEMSSKNIKSKPLELKSKERLKYRKQKLKKSDR